MCLRRDDEVAEVSQTRIYSDDFIIISQLKKGHRIAAFHHPTSCPYHAVQSWTSYHGSGHNSHGHVEDVLSNPLDEVPALKVNHQWLPNKCIDYDKHGKQIT